MQRLAADRARLVGQRLGDGRYRVTGEVTLPASPERVRACLTDVALLRRWAVGGKVGTRLSGGDGRYTFHFRMSSAMTMTMYGELRVDEPRRVVRHYSDARPGSDPGTGQERIVEYVLEPAPAGTIVRCVYEADVPGLGDRGGRVVADAEAASLAHSLERLAHVAAGRRMPWWRRVFAFVFPKSPMPV
ncbi:SRPBCC family protein [Nocardia farcinica]|uniref:SRPBCC family protein n=1 Tax=Nocardia farcinica TaxID=37329 RepID=UPI00245533A2|nr:SRPBCC family protein [Nocardia farcinica]